MDQRKTTNMLLLALVIPVLFYLLHILKFIFIPLVFSMFIALLFLPLMRWLQRKNVHKYISIAIVLVIIIAALKLGGDIIKLSSQEIMASDSQFFAKAETKITDLIITIQSEFGIQQSDSNPESIKDSLLNKDALISNFGSTIGFLNQTLTMILMTMFFVVLWLAESINVQKLMHKTILKKKHAAIKAFRKIEKDLIKFIKVKFLVSLLTGIGTGLACLYFDVSFPIFWGFFAFIINFVQMVGSFIAVISLSTFALVELDPTSHLFFFVVSITMVQVLFGAILEPIFMGKSFSINIITVLVMLMFWGFLWGIPGLIMAIPITVFFKIIFDQFPNTKVLASIISGSDN